MARYQYEGRDRKRVRTGVISASSRREAAERLRDEGIRVLDMREMEETALQKEITIGNPVKREQYIMFLRQFSTLIRAGVTVVDAVSILSRQIESKALKRTLESVYDDLRKGMALSGAMAKFPKVFEPLTVNLIRAGELSGTIDEALDRLATHYEKAYQTRQKVISALTYPAVVAFIAVGVVIFLLTSIVPMFVEMFESFGGELPLLTQFVMSASSFTQQYWYVLVLLVGLMAAVLYILRRNPQGRFLLDTVLLRLPIFGKIIQKSALARMTRSLSSLFSSSVPILQAMSMVEQVVGNEVLARVVHSSRDSLQRGGSLTEPMRDHWAFPPLIPHMISIGEQTGALDHMLGKVAEFYEKEVDQETERLKSLIEPLMIVLLAGLVGTIVLSIMLPMFEMFENVDNL